LRTPCDIASVEYFGSISLSLFRASSSTQVAQWGLQVIGVVYESKKRGGRRSMERDLCGGFDQGGGRLPSGLTPRAPQKSLENTK
jgi:hypothetical protein